MRRRLRLLGGPVGITLGWTTASVLIGVQIMITLGVDGELPQLALPGLVAGAAFAAVNSLLWMAILDFNELSLARAGAWGAAAGLPLGILGFLTTGGTLPLWPWAPVFAGAGMLGSAVTAAASLAVSRLGDERG